MLAGLAAIHVSGAVHFDVKPSNILFSDTGKAMVADFGQARSIGPTGVVKLPPMYPITLPPEFFLTGIGTVHSDIYHAGVTLYRAVNGEPMFEAQKNKLTDMKHSTVNGKFPNRDKFMPHVPMRLRTIIRKAMSVDPKDRYQSATEFARSLGAVDLEHDWSSATFSQTANAAGWRPEISSHRSSWRCDLTAANGTSRSTLTVQNRGLQRSRCGRPYRRTRRRQISPRGW